MSKCRWCRGCYKPCTVPVMVRFRQEANVAVKGIGTSCAIPEAYQDDCPTRKLAEDAQRLAALVEGLRNRIADTRAMLSQWPDLVMAVVGGVLGGIEDDLAAQGFLPPAEKGP